MVSRFPYTTFSKKDVFRYWICPKKPMVSILHPFLSGILATLQKVIEIRNFLAMTNGFYNVAKEIGNAFVGDGRRTRYSQFTYSQMTPSKIQCRISMDINVKHTYFHPSHTITKTAFTITHQGFKIVEVDLKASKISLRSSVDSVGNIWVMKYFGVWLYRC